MGFEKISAARAAPGFDIGDRFAVFQWVNRGVLLRIECALNLAGGLRARIHDMQNEYTVLGQCRQ